MRVTKLVATMGLSVLLFGLLGSASVVAAPEHAPNAETIVASCSNGSTAHQFTIISNGDAQWTPGFVIAIDGEPVKVMLIPLSVSGTFYPDVAIDGQTEIELFTAEKPGKRNGVNDVYACTLDPEYFSVDDPDNPFGVGGNIVVSFTGFEAGPRQ